MNKIGLACGVCFNCGRELCKSRNDPEKFIVCDCYKYCPRNHGKGSYGTEMLPYSPDLTPNSYGPITEKGKAWGDLDHQMNILYYCPTCGYHSSLKPIEVKVS
jgi:hypothetical protein